MRKGKLVLKKNVKITIVSLLGVVIIGLGIALFMMNSSVIEFTVNPAQVEINGEYDASEFIKKVNGHELSEVTIDDSKVDVTKLGEYEIIYKIKDKEYSLKVEVVDTTAPTYEISDLKCALGVEIKPEDFVKDIQDQTQTTVSFKEEYKFDSEKEYEVIIVVEDEGKNKTEKKATLTVIKDTEKPVLEGLKDFSTTPGGKIDYLKDVTAKDNLDANPKIDVDSSKVDLSKVGTYDIIYTVTDQTGNKNTYTKKVNVVEKVATSTKSQSGTKTVYLTFDDGPSANTAKVLEVLDKYNAKATFFVTGNGKNYNYLIKEAHDKGHTIALHTYSHDYKTVYSSVDAYFNDLNKVGNMVKDLIGYFPKYIRFPGGASNTVSRHYSKGIMSTLTAEVQNRGFQYYDWNASSGDASGNNVAVEKLIKGGTESNSTNVMLLCHDTAAKSTTVQALPQIIEHYKNLGYVFKGIDDDTFTPHQHVNN